METFIYKGYTISHVWRGAWHTNVEGEPKGFSFSTLKKAKAWVDTHPPGWQSTYEKVRYAGASDGTEYTVFLRDPAVVPYIRVLWRTVEGPLLDGWKVKRDGSIEQTYEFLLPFAIRTEAVLERTPMRMDPDSKQLEEL